MNAPAEEGEACGEGTRHISMRGDTVVHAYLTRLAKAREVHFAA